MTKVKRKKRVSFSLPPKEADDGAAVKPKVSVSVVDSCDQKPSSVLSRPNKPKSSVKTQSPSLSRQNSKRINSRKATPRKPTVRPRSQSTTTNNKEPENDSDSEDVPSGNTDGDAVVGHSDDSGSSESDDINSDCTDSKSEGTLKQEHGSAGDHVETMDSSEECSENESEDDSDDGDEEDGDNDNVSDMDDGENDSNNDRNSDKATEKEEADIPNTDGRTDEPDLISPLETPSPVETFGELKLDPRIERAIERTGWKKPSSVQSSVIPIALHGRDVMVTAPTGSGKTAAYAIPLVQHLCRARSFSSLHAPALRAVVFVPTRELVYQVTTVLKSLCRFLDGVHVSAISVDKKDKPSKRVKGKAKSGMLHINGSSDVIVGTPASVAAIRAGADTDPLSTVEFVVVDEADLVLNYGYEKETRDALSSIPTTAQAMLVSATLKSEGMDNFRKIVLRRPLTVKVTSEVDAHENSAVGATHYFSRLTNHRNRYLVVYAMLRLNVLCGKVLIFVNHINAAFKLKLFLDQFKVKSAVLNSELPANSRIHCVNQFNAGIFDILIAADESGSGDGTVSERKEMSKERKSKKRRRIDKDEEFGLSRGVDFKDVGAVLNFDIPESTKSYTHRAGRTARGGSSGTVLTLVCSKKEEEDVLAIGKEVGVHIGPLAFRMQQVEAFRYRVEDCLKLVTDTAVNGARLADVKREMVNSETLKGYFEDNPNDLEALQHNVRLAQNVAEHLGHIPKYLMPPGLRNTTEKRGQTSGGRPSRGGRLGRVSANDKKQADPLKGFSMSGSSRSRFQAKKGIKKRKHTGGGAVQTRRRRFSHTKK